jgi:phage-related baseplate assembly protein
MVDTLASLQATKTRAQATDELVAVLTGLGFPAATWGPTSVPRAILEVASVAVEYASQYAAALAGLVFLDTATGAGLTAKAKSDFTAERYPAVSARYSVTLSTLATVGPYAVAAGALVVTDGAHTARNVYAVTLTAGSSTAVMFQSDTIGTVGALSLGSLRIATPLAGVSIATSSQMRAAAEAESDAALVARCKAQWGELSIEVVDDGVVSVIRTSGTGAITRIQVDSSNPRGAGTVDVYCATADGTPGTDDLTAARAALALRVMGTVGADSTADWLVVAAGSTSVNVAGTIYTQAGYSAATVKAAVDLALAAYFKALPIGGKSLPSAAHRVFAQELWSTIWGVPGVAGVTLTTPAADVTLASNAIAVLGTVPALGDYQAVG